MWAYIIAAVLLAVSIKLVVWAQEFPLWFLGYYITFLGFTCFLMALFIIVVRLF